jgi:two-component system sensor histidine kinase YesM
VYPLSKLVENVTCESGSVVLYYEDEPLFGVQPPAELPAQKNQAILLGGISGYLVAQASEDELTLARFDMENSRFANMLPNVLIVLAVVVLLILALGLLYLWQGFYLPVARLAHTMTELEQGTFDAERLNHVYSGAEFRQMNSSLKKLLSQITDLKIKTYEKELERRDAQLQYLRAQIRPHFYLNCLKNLYAMAQVSTPEKMQESILYLSKHMRYIFSDHAQEEPLSKELDLCQNYVALFGSMNIDYKITCDVEIAPAVRDVPIPPVTILSLVENSVKYSIRQSRTLKIFITATRLELEEGALLNISVKDNGEGFSQEWLETFNRLEANPDASQHVGMANLVRRCREIYGDQFHIAFYNGHKTDDYCGACIDLFWPLNGGAGQDEAADRG